ncbi:MAG TPA: toll/interleukin-1 receptor domain-containing protein [Allosphingosinicella sp.]|nr:toll/interleukin-1 receptor domain-containing protein [Allosphingosinicella sp.]
MAQVFVSYSRVNRDRIVTVSDALEESGYSVWWDRALKPGDDYAILIEEQINAAPCVVVAWSETARQSLWVRAEANEALDAGKLVQISLDKTKLPLPFSALNHLDFSGWGGARGEECWVTLDGRVRRRLNGEWVDAHAPPQGPALQGLARISLLGWASILLAGLIFIGTGLVATGTLSAQMFGGIAMAALGAAVILFALIAFTVTKIGRASRR